MNKIKIYRSNIKYVNFFDKNNVFYIFWKFFLVLLIMILFVVWYVVLYEVKSCGYSLIF